MTFRGASSANETTAVVTAGIEDLDIEALQAWLRQHAPRLAADDVPVEDALLRLRLATMMGSRLHPTMAGLYVFGHEPQFAMPQLAVVVARFDGRDLTADIVDRRAIGGRLEELVLGAQEFIESTGRKLINQVDPEHSALEFPPRAVHEALVNALVHRDLRAGGPVAVRSFEDRLEIWSPGPPSGLPEDIRTYLARGGVSLPRNPLVAVLARQLGLADQLGRGLPLMRRVVEEEAHAKLLIEGAKDGVLVTIPSALEVSASRTDILAN